MCQIRIAETRGKSCNEILAEAAEPWSPQPVYQIYHAPGIEGRSGGEALQNAASPGAYGQLCGHEGPKMPRYPSGDGDGTLPNLVFTDEKKFDIQQVVSQ